MPTASTVSAERDDPAAGVELDMYVPAWAQVGMEVEASETAPEFDGAFASGEVLEWVRKPSAAALAADAAKFSGIAGGTQQYSATAPKPGKPKATGPWARVQTRMVLPPSPYNPSGLLVTERCVSVSRLRPRPPPPPADFLCDVRVGEQLQLRYEGLWWDVTLVGFSTEVLPGDSGDEQAPRYHVSCAAHTDVSGAVSARALRPRWCWDDDQWVLESAMPRLTAKADTSSAAAIASSTELSSSSDASASLLDGSTLPVALSLPATVARNSSTSAPGTDGMADAGTSSSGSSSRLVMATGGEQTGGGGEQASGADQLKGVSAPEARGRMLRAWLQDGRDAVPETGVVLGHVSGRGLATKFDDGVYWIDGRIAWEWVPIDEEKRPIGYNFHSTDPRRKGWMSELLVRVWLPIASGERISRVGRPVSFHPRRGLRLRYVSE